MLFRSHRPRWRRFLVRDTGGPTEPDGLRLHLSSVVDRRLLRQTAARHFGGEPPFRLFTTASSQAARNDLRVGLPARGLHDLTDKEANDVGLAGLVRSVIRDCRPAPCRRRPRCCDVGGRACRVWLAAPRGEAQCPPTALCSAGAKETGGRRGDRSSLICLLPRPRLFNAGADKLGNQVSRLR